MSPEKLDEVKEKTEKSTKAHNVQAEKHQKLQQKLKQLELDHKEKSRKGSMHMQAIVDAKRKRLLTKMQEVIHLKDVCKADSTLGTDELKAALGKVQLQPVVIAQTMHKVAILRSIGSALDKLNNLRKLNKAHQQFTLNKVGTGLIAAVKEIEQTGYLSQPLHMPSPDLIDVARFD